MGEAARTKKHAQAQFTTLQEAVGRVSAVLIKLASAASAHLASDCFLHAYLGKALLEDLGIQSELRAGYAAWRVGAGDSDVIAHVNGLPGHLPVGVMGFPYHVWLKSGAFLIDFTTYLLPQKAKALDKADGGQTTVEWNPLVLLLPHEQIVSFRSVARHPDAGVVYYERIEDVEQLVFSMAVCDQSDLAVARLLLAEPEMRVIGINNGHVNEEEN